MKLAYKIILAIPVVAIYFYFEDRSFKNWVDMKSRGISTPTNSEIEELVKKKAQAVLKNAVIKANKLNNEVRAEPQVDVSISNLECSTDRTAIMNLNFMCQYDAKINIDGMPYRRQYETMSVTKRTGIWIDMGSEEFTQLFESKEKNAHEKPSITSTTKVSELTLEHSNSGSEKNLKDNDVTKLENDAPLDYRRIWLEIQSNPSAYISTCKQEEVQNLKKYGAQNSAAIESNIVQNCKLKVESITKCMENQNSNPQTCITDAEEHGD